MSPDEVIERLAALGVETSRSTLSRWGRMGIIPQPAVGSLGRGMGGYSEFKRATVWEAYATGMMLKAGLSAGSLMGVRLWLYALARRQLDPRPTGIIPEMNMRTWALLAGKASSEYADTNRKVRVSIAGLDDEGCIEWEVEPWDRYEFG